MTTDQPTPSADPLVFDGEMTIYSATANFQRLRERIGKRLPIQIDLSAVTEIDSSGLQLLLYARAEADDNGLDFSLAGLSESVTDVFNLLYLNRTFGISSATQPETSA
ncbi:STAS domain-containing protein [Rhabdochromatium marinum]|uniref:STAS domain-containing protein n=1 Tax=Rhabdochromatium marinum TaxID=48729 RepID=UPI001906A20A|nr:STAS domain-containing protein [Rhabdochromatium marinum]MBK1647810.1 hypothetical protein [Rhabdochromatium marinum]